MPMTLKRTDRVPVTQGETRRKLLLLTATFGGSQPGSTNYLITENHEPIVFGDDRILLKPQKIDPSDETSDIVDVGLVDYMILQE